MGVAEGGADVCADCVAGGRGVEGCVEGGAVEVAVVMGDGGGHCCMW